MKDNDSSGQIGRDTDSDSIGRNPPANHWFPSLDCPHCVEILRLAADQWRTKDFVVRGDLGLSDERYRECLSQLEEDGLIVLESPDRGQYIALTTRGSWAATTHVDHTSGTTQEVSE